MTHAGGNRSAHGSSGDAAWPRKLATFLHAQATVRARLQARFPDVAFHHAHVWLLRDVVARLADDFPAVEFDHECQRAAMRPEGGILSIVTEGAREHPILIAERKHHNGRGKPAENSVIDRLAKNVICLRAAMLSEAIFPFVLFADGSDFVPGSPFRDRAAILAMFGKLGVEHLHHEGARGLFNRGTFYVREEEWPEAEIVKRCWSIAEKSILYYFAKYGEAAFRWASTGPRQER